MRPFTTLKAPAVPWLKANVDTDQIIPKQYLSTVTRTGLGRGLFHDLRWCDDGGENPDFILNQPAYRGAQILLAGPNFGCGSSREHAPWALLDFGIRCIAAPSFAEIFYNNCLNNGVLPAIVDQGDLAALAQEADGRDFEVDLAAQTLVAQSGRRLDFVIDEARKEKLLLGRDDIAVTLTMQVEIARYEACRAASVRAPELAV